MTSLSLRQNGLRRMGVGFTLLRRAMRDAVRGPWLILTGIAAFLAGLVIALWMGAARVFAAPAAAIRWVVRLLVIGLAAVGVSVALAGVERLLRDTHPDLSGLVYPLTLFGGLAVVVLLAVAATRLVAALLAMLLRFLTPEGARILAAIALVLVAAGLGAILYAVVRPPFVLALVAGLSVAAGLGGVALVSLGPSALSLFQLGGKGGGTRPTGVEVIHSPTAALGDPRPRRSLRQLRPAIGSRTERIAPPLIEYPGRVAADVGKTEAAIRPAAVRNDRSSRWSTFRRRWSATILLVVALACLLAWLGGELLLRAFKDTDRPALSSAERAAPLPSAPPATSETAAPQPIRLLADGVLADIAWRSGFRQATARLDTGGVVRDLALPPTACQAGAVLVFGAASSDGDPARNDALARRRAGWLARWTQAQLARCPGAPPEVLAVSLGQARSGPPRPAQRAVRLMAVRAEDLDGAGGGADPQTLRRMVQTAFDDLGAFERFEACSLAPLTGSSPPGRILRACDE